MSHCDSAATRAALGVVGVALLISLSACGAATTSANTAPSPTSTLSTASPTTAGPTVLFQSTLTPPPSGWESDPAVGCFFDSTGFHVKQIGECNLPLQNLLEPTDTWENADITVQVKQISGPSTQVYGIGLGSGPQIDRFAIDSAGKWTFLVCNGSNCTATDGLAASPAIHAGSGASNTLEVRVVTTHFDVFVNGTKVGQADDNNYGNISGQSFLVGNDASEVVFTNLKITTAS